MSLALRLAAHRLPQTASCVCAHSAPESNTASSSLRSGNFKTPFSWAVGLGKNVNVISQTVRNCMQIPCIHEAPFTARLSSVSQPQLSALTRLEVDGMDQAVIYVYWQIHTIMRLQDSVHACENTVTLNTEHSDVAQSLPSLIVMTLRRLSSRR